MPQNVYSLSVNRRREREKSRGEERKREKKDREEGEEGERERERQRERGGGRQASKQERTVEEVTARTRNTQMGERRGWGNYKRAVWTNNNGIND